MENLTLMQKFADPEIIKSLTAGEKATGSLVTALMGMGITFVVLMLIWGMVALMTKIFQEKPTALAEVAIEPTAATIQAAPIATTEEDDSELIAVIAAAIAASTGTSVDSFVVQKINRVSGHRPAWGRAGISESIDSRRM